MPHTEFNITVVGPSGSGKTKAIWSYITGSSADGVIAPTVGCGKWSKRQDNHIVTFMDTPGDIRFAGLIPASYISADMIIYMGDREDEERFLLPSHTDIQILYLESNSPLTW
jgi:GTPase SAR1 family protein